MNEQSAELMGHAPGESGEVHAHVVPVRLFALVWISLMALTVITVAVTYVDLGGLNLWVAMMIATVKALLVALYFMHLRWDRLFNGFVFICGLVFVGLFVGIALMDTSAYKPELIPGYSPGMERVQQSQQVMEQEGEEAGEGHEAMNTGEDMKMEEKPSSGEAQNKEPAAPEGESPSAGEGGGSGMEHGGGG